MAEQTKTCTGCGITKPLTTEFFHRRLSTFHARCKACRHEKAVLYALEPKHREQQRVRMSRWLTKNKERKREQDRLYSAKDRAGAAEKSRRWYKQNRERASARAKLYRRAHPEQHLIYGRNRKARKKGAAGHHTKEQTAAIRLRQKNKCAYCRQSLGRKGQLDHIVPLARGGSNWPSNLQWLCAPCNHAKRAKDPINYAQSIGFLL